MKIVTLCDNCKKLYEENFSVKKYSLRNSTTKPKDCCEQCGRKIKDMDMFIIDRKGK